MSDTDKELAKAWASRWIRLEHRQAMDGLDTEMAAARYILATLSRPEMPLGIPAGCGVHPFISAVCSRGTKSCVVDHGAIERLTKERDEALARAMPPGWSTAKPAAEDAELSEGVNGFRTGRNVDWSGIHQADWANRVQHLLLLLAARVKELKARG